MAKVISLACDVLTLDADVQPRETMSSDHIRELAALYQEGHTLEPIIVFHDGIDYWVADGFHRVSAARQAGLTEIDAYVEEGTKRDAIYHACGANKHGKARSSADKRRAVMRILTDEEWGTKSLREMGHHCGVSEHLVRIIQRELSASGAQINKSDERIITRNGTQYPMNTARLRMPSPEMPVLTPMALPVADDMDRHTIERTFPIAHTLPTFNKTNEMVDWAKWTWNPVTGCLHTCVYCYARDIAERFYPEKFAPTFRPERLKAPQYTKVPPEADDAIGWRNVFVCSMADLFGKWVPQDWIDAVLEEVRAAPQWNFLFLTKFPQRLAEIRWPSNAWVGTTVDEQYRVEIAEKVFRKVDAAVKWLSCEPLRERLTFSSLGMFDWVVLGGQSASTQAPAFQPPWEWVEHLWQQARQCQCLVYWKPNLLTRPCEYPGQRVASSPGEEA